MQEQKLLSSDETDHSNSYQIVLEDIGDEEDIKLIEVHLNPQLKSNNTSKILLFPGIEGFAKKFSRLVPYLDAPAISFQFWENPELQTIQEMAQLLLPVGFSKNLTKPNKFIYFPFLLFRKLKGILNRMKDLILSCIPWVV